MPSILQNIPTYKPSERDFLSCNPFPHPLTQGFFYREKMRAIHYIAPNQPYENVLEVGGGQGGLTALLYPRSQVTNIDLNPQCRPFIALSSRLGNGRKPFVERSMAWSAS